MESVDNLSTQFNSLCINERKRSQFKKCISPPLNYLHIEYITNSTKVDNTPHYCKLKHLNQDSIVYKSFLHSYKILPSNNSSKKYLEITVKISDKNFYYEPGQTFGIFCENDINDVSWLLHRLKLENVADIPYQLSTLPNTTANIPQHLPVTGTLRTTLSQYCNLRFLPKKNETEKETLREWGSREYNDIYVKEILQNGLTFLDLLAKFPSCKIRESHLLELLPPLLPRPYSAASSFLMESQQITFLLSIKQLNTPSAGLPVRYGVCSGWLEHLCLSNYNCNPSIYLYRRYETNFKLPYKNSTPLILIATGAGFAPFRSFIWQRYVQFLSGQKFGSITLFFGCSNDKLYKEELDELQIKLDMLKVYRCFSKSVNSSEILIQDCLLSHRKECLELLEMNAIVYVCGNVNKMLKDVRQAFVYMLADRRKTLEELIFEKRYIEDQWT